MVEKVLVHALVEPELKDRIEQERGHETRSSFIRRILIRWYNKLPSIKKKIEE